MMKVRVIYQFFCRCKTYTLWISLVCVILMLEIQQCETSECTKKELYLDFVLEYLEYARLETTYT